MAAARLAEGLQRVRALALPRGARRARDRRPAAHRRLRHRRGRRRDSLGLRCSRAREIARRRRVRHRLLRRGCIRLGLATRGYSGRRCRDARLRTRGSSLHARERLGPFRRPSTGDRAARGGGDNPAVRRPRLRAAHLRNSQAAVDARNATQARSEALAAKAIEPWAASPYLQLGLVSEAEGDYDAAAQWLDEAISRSRRDYSLWLIAARIEARARQRPPGDARPAGGAPPQPEFARSSQGAVSGDRRKPKLPCLRRFGRVLPQPHWRPPI